MFQTIHRWLSVAVYRWLVGRVRHRTNSRFSRRRLFLLVHGGAIF